MIKKYAIEVGSAVVAIFAVAFLMTAGNILSLRADAAGTTTIDQTIVRIDQAGKVLVRGTIESVTPGAIVVKSWGGNWTGNIGVMTQILPALAGNDVAQFKQGDYVGIQGTVDASADWTIHATVVRDWTYGVAATAEKKQNVAAAHEAALSAPKNYVGIASGVSVGTGSFTLTIKDIADTVNVAADTEIVNRNWITLPIAGIRDGDTLRVWGVNASGTIAAAIVRDMSVPATSTPVQVL